MKSVLIIIPAKKKEKSILNVVSNIKKVKTNNYLIDYIIINDGSSDNTKKSMFR